MLPRQDPSFRIENLSAKMPQYTTPKATRIQSRSAQLTLRTPSPVRQRTRKSSFVRVIEVPEYTPDQFNTPPVFQNFHLSPHYRTQPMCPKTYTKELPIGRIPSKKEIAKMMKPPPNVETPIHPTEDLMITTNV